MSTYIFIIIIILLIYSSFYFIFSDEVTIYQTDLEHFDFNMLYKKQPIVIGNSVQEPNEIIKLWFNTNIVNANIVHDKLWEKNKYKYLLVYSDDAEITLCHPYHRFNNDIPDSSRQLTTIKLKNKRILIIPFKWYYHIEGNVALYGIHDYITKIFEYVI